MRTTATTGTTKQKTAQNDTHGGFVAAKYEIENQHGVQIFVDGGVTPGPWLGVGVNNSLFVLGWVPEEFAAQYSRPAIRH